MSLWSNIGDVFEGMGDAGRDGLGAAWDVATAVGGGANWAYQNSTLPEGFHAIGEGYRLFGRATSTAAQVTGGFGVDAAPMENPLDPGDWRKAWNRTRPDREGGATSVGQVLAFSASAAPKLKDGSTPTLDNISTMGAGQKNYDPWFSFTSGTLDVVASWYTDPFVLAGKGVKLSHDAVTAVRPGDLSAIKAAEETGSKTTVRQKAVANRFDSLVNETRDKNTAQLLQYGFLRDNEAGDTIASLIAAANKVPDKALRDSKVKDILRVGMGDMDTLARMKAENDTLAFDMENLNQSLDWMTDAATSPLASGRMTDRLSAKIAQTQAEIGARESYQRELDKFLDPQSGAYGRLGTRLQGANVFDRHRLNQLDRSSGVVHGILQDGVGSTPVHVFDYVTGARPAGVVNLHDAADVNMQLGHQMQRVKGLDPETKQKLLTRVGDANDDASRQVVVQQVEDQVFMHVARQVLGDDVKREAVDSILNDYRLKHADAAQRAYPQQAFAGSSGGSPWGMDPQTGQRLDLWNDGEGNWMARPVVSTQLANSLPLMDVDEIYRVLKRHKSAIRAFAGAGLDPVNALANTGLTVWKFGKLARLGYPIRTIADAQLRMLAVLGGASHAFEVMGPGIRNLAHNTLTKGEERHLGMGQVNVRGYKVPDFHGTSASDYEASMGKIDAKQTFENLMGTEQDFLRKSLRGSGQFTVRHGDDPLYEGDWLRAANFQLRQDPLVQQILANGEDAAQSWLKRTPEGRSVAKRLRPIYDDDYTEMVRKHNLLIDNVTGGNDGLRMALGQADVTVNDLKQAFPTPGARPSIHGESIDATMNKGPVADLWAKTLRGFYKVTSDIPETQLGRHPLAVVLYRRHLDDLIGHADPKGLGTLAPDDLERIRTAAVSLARRDMKRTLYNISSQPNMAAGMWKFIFPFFGAFQDVALKYGKLIYDDPSRLARANLILDSPNRAGITVDKDGNIIAPGHPLGDGQFVIVPSIPGVSSIAKWKLSKQSANVVLAGDPVWLPGFGPLMGVSANEIAKRYPRTESLFDKAGLLPFGAQESSFNMVNPAPTWSVQLWRASHPDNAEYREVYAQILAAENMAIRDGSRKNPGEQELLDEVGTRTSAWFMARAVANFGMPLSATPVTKYQLYFDLAHKYQEQYGADAQMKFYQDHPQYFDAMVSLSKNNTGIQATKEGVDASRKWSKEIAKFPEFGAMFVGPEDEGQFSSAARVNQLSTRVGPGTSERFREKKDPVQAMKDINVSRGWIVYRQWADKIDAALATRKAQGGSDSLSATANSDLAMAKKIIVTDLSQQNADWFYDYGQRDTARLPKFLAAAKIAVDSPKAKGRGDLDALRIYMDYRDRFRQVLAKRATGGGSSSLSAQSNADLAQAWGILTSDLKSRYVTFSDIFTRNLEGDDLSQEAVQ